MTIQLHHVGLEWPNSTQIFKDLNFSFNHKIYGLVGPNGIGKTTLARILVGELKPTTGHIETGQNSFGYFAQEHLRPAMTVIEFLLETGTLEDQQLLAYLKEIDLSLACELLSGGEWARVRLAKLLAERASFSILDEPTNHLDQEGRQGVIEALPLFSGGVLIISHDRDLLSLVDEILELSTHGIQSVVGNFADYEAFRTNEREKLEKTFSLAKKEKALQTKLSQQRIEKQRRRQRAGEKNAKKGGMPKILMGARKRMAQQTLGKINKETTDKMEQKVRQVQDAYDLLKLDPVMFAQLPQVDLPKGKVIFEVQELNLAFEGCEALLWSQNVSFIMRGPQRLVIRGKNGTGKTTLLKLLHGESMKAIVKGQIKRGELGISFIDQHYALLDQSRSVLQNVMRNCGLPEDEARQKLATFLFMGEHVHQKVATLSGGEKLRASLACALLKKIPPNVLLFDEPTNNLDWRNLEFLEQLLLHYKGALVVVSHDQVFLERIGVESEVIL